MPLHPQVKALMHEGPESPHRRSLIPPVTFEVSGCALSFLAQDCRKPLPSPKEEQ